MEERAPGIYEVKLYSTGAGVDEIRIFLSGIERTETESCTGRLPDTYGSLRPHTPVLRGNREKRE